MERIKIRSKKEAGVIIREIEELTKKGQLLTERQVVEYNFVKILLNEIKQRKKN